MPSTPTGISVVREIRRFNELEDQLDQPVDQSAVKRKGKNKRDKINNDDVILQDDEMNSNETAAKALLQITKNINSA